MPRIIDRSNHTAVGLGQAGAAFAQNLQQTQGLILQLQQRDERDAQDISTAQERARLMKAQSASIEQETAASAAAAQLNEGFPNQDEANARNYILGRQGEEGAAVYDSMASGRAREGVTRQALESAKRDQEAEDLADLYTRLDGAATAPQGPDGGAGKPEDAGLYSPEEVQEIKDAIQNRGTTRVEQEREFTRRLKGHAAQQRSIAKGAAELEGMRATLTDPRVMERVEAGVGKEAAEEIISEYEANLRFRPGKVDHKKFQVDFELATSSAALREEQQHNIARAEAAEAALAQITGLQAEELRGLIQGGAPPQALQDGSFQALKADGTPAGAFDEVVLDSIPAEERNAPVHVKDVNPEQAKEAAVWLSKWLNDPARESITDLAEFNDALLKEAARIGIKGTPAELKVFIESPPAKEQDLGMSAGLDAGYL